MKMEGSDLKLNSKTSDTGGLTFGPAWLRQLSSGDSTKVALPPSPGLAFQLAKNRYGREEMLVIYEAIEKSILQPPPNLEKEFEDLFKKDLQRPVLLSQPTTEEQKFLSTCVNSQVVLNSYNKIQGQSGLSNSSNNNISSNNSSKKSENGEAGVNVNNRNALSVSRGGSNSLRGSRGASSVGGSGLGRSSGTGERGIGAERGGRGRGRGRGSDSQHTAFKSIDEESGPLNVNNTRGGKSGFKTNYSRSHNWEDREANNGSNHPVKKEYSRGVVEENWRNKAIESDTNSIETKQNNAEENVPSSTLADTNTFSSNSTNEIQKKNTDNEIKNSKLNSDTAIDTTSKENENNNEKNSRNWKNTTENTKSNQSSVNREWPNKKPNMPSNSYNSNDMSKNRNTNRNPEWLMDNDEENAMTFDESGKFVSVKELKNRNVKLSDSASIKKNESDLDNEKEKSTEKESQLSADVKNLNISQSNNNYDNLKEIPGNHLPSNEKIFVENSLSGFVNQNKINIDKSNLLTSQPLIETSYDNSLNTNIAAPHQINNDILSSINSDPKLGAVSMDHPDAERWFYLDPQNQIQGSFSSEQMAGWFAAGYFTLNLMIKRGCDDKFLPLGVITTNWGRIPFTSGPPLPNQLATHSKIQQLQQPQSQQNWSKEQILNQMQLFQQMQQLQFFPQNFNVLRNELNHQSQNINMSNLGAMLQQLQQLQLQQKAAAASVNNLGTNAVLNIMHDLKSQQEALINQFNINNNINNNKSNNSVLNDPSMIDPAILGSASANKVQSIWGDTPVSRISPITTIPQLTPPISISPINNILQQNNSNTVNPLATLMSSVDNPKVAAAVLNQINNNTSLQMLNENSVVIKDKIQALFEQTKKEEERRRKLEDEYQVKLKKEEDEKKRMQEEQLQREEEFKRLEEERIREEKRKELQRKKLEEIIKKQEEEKKKLEEAKRQKEKETKQKEKVKKQDENKEIKKVDVQQLNEETEKKKQIDQQTESLKKQNEALEKAKQKSQQDQLNNLQLPAHASWAKIQPQQQQQQQQQALQLKAILEQQELESMQQRALLEQQKQAEQQNNQHSGQSKWSNLFRGNSQQTPSIVSSTNSIVSSQQPISLATIQAEQTKLQENVVKQPATMSQKLSSNKQSAPQINSTSVKQTANTWAAWGNTSTKQLTETVSNSKNSNSGFWGEVNENKKTNPSKIVNSIPTSKNSKNQFPELNPSSYGNDTQNVDKINKGSKKNASIEETNQTSFLRNVTISDEFMKWCHEQLKYFQVDLHIPTFVNFLREIETCAEIEDYVINYLGDSQQAKDFAQQFYINRESQQTNSTSERSLDETSPNYSRDVQFSKQKQKKRSKGQKLDTQLLGFTVQPDPNLKNRGDIDPL